MDGVDALSVMAAHAQRFLQDLESPGSWNEVNQQKDAVISSVVKSVGLAAAGHDSFDLLELARQHQMPLALEGFRESQSQRSPAVLDVVSLIVLGLRGRVFPPQGEERSDLPGKIIEITESAAQVTSLLTILSFGIEGPTSLAALNDLAGQVRSSESLIRGKHYASISDAINARILGPQNISTILDARFGFTHHDVLAVSEATREMHADGYATRFRLIEQVRQSDLETGLLSDDDRLAAQAALREVFQYPGRTLAFTVEEVAESCGVDPLRVARILEYFSIEQGASSAEALLNDFVEGANPLAGRGFVRDSDQNYLLIGSGIPVDGVRRQLEAGLKGGPSWSRYGRHRDARTEELAVSAISTLLEVDKPTYRSLYYRVPDVVGEKFDLASTSTEPLLNTKDVESDALFVVGDVAVCLEVKAGGLSEKARTGDVGSIENNLERTIGDAAKQAQRLEKLIIENGGLWTPESTWVDLSHIREVHTVVACLEDFGPLAIGVDSLIRADLISGSVPWIVSIHDLEVACKLLSPPGQFLLYLRRRTEPEVIKKVMATDELDILMWFLNGDFYYEPDPDELRQKYPYMLPVTKAERARFRKQIPTRVGTFTDPLDAWMYFEEGQSLASADRPSRTEGAKFLEIVEFLRASESHGWLSIGADFFNLSSDTQKTFAKSVRHLTRECRSDGNFHTGAFIYVSPWGMSLLVVGTQPANGPEYLSRLIRYMRIKKYQTISDRAVCVMFGEDGEILDARYDNAYRVEDPDLDEIVNQMGLASPSDGSLHRRGARKKRKLGRKRGRR